jgi:hypothetical protein
MKNILNHFFILLENKFKYWKYTILLVKADFDYHEDSIYKKK